MDKGGKRRKGGTRHHMGLSSVQTVAVLCQLIKSVRVLAMLMYREYREAKPIV